MFRECADTHTALTHAIIDTFFQRRVVDEVAAPVSFPWALDFEDPNCVDSSFHFDIEDFQQH